MDVTGPVDRWTGRRRSKSLSQTRPGHCHRTDGRPPWHHPGKGRLAGAYIQLVSLLAVPTWFGNVDPGLGDDLFFSHWRT